MSSELLPPPADPGVTLVEGGPRPGVGPRPRTAADAPIAVEGRVPPGRAGPGRGFTFDIARALGTVVVTAQGRIDEDGARVLKHVLVDLIENQGNMTVVVDLHGVTDLDLGCADIFVTAHHRAIIRGGELSLTGARLRVARALDVTGVDRLVKVTSDRILAVPADPAARVDLAAGEGPSPPA